ncbi:MAG: efflux RND transporter periplasmic adaptor subunit [Gammaproteobacteria bacterium]
MTIYIQRTLKPPFTRINAFILLCLLIGGNGNALNCSYAADGDDAIPEASDNLHLDETIQKRAGLSVTVLKPFQYVPELLAYGNAQPLQPLLNLRNRYIAAQAQYQSALARLALAQQNINRAQHLHRNGIASERVLQEQQSQLRMEKTQTDALRVTVEATFNEAVLSWGHKLADLFLSNDTDRLIPYLSGRKALLQISLPAGHTLPQGIDNIYVSASGNRNQARPAELISRAPLTDIITQGESYYFSSADDSIRTGMRIVAWLPRLQRPEAGVLIPASALVWHLGQAYVYLQTGAESFSRRRIAHFTHTPDGYFVQGTLAAGEKLITTGAQMLLSEEFRGQIPDEDDD